IWRRRAARRVELVVAAISGDPASHGFSELGTALAAACRLVSERGQIVVLSSIHASPGPTLESVHELPEPGKRLEYLRRRPAADAISTWQILRATQRARIYLLSRLNDELVEDLGMTPTPSPQEVQRLVSQARSCLVLNDAQLAYPMVEG